MRSTENSHEADNRAEIPARRVGRGRCLFVAGVFVCGLSAACDAFCVDRGISVWESNRTATIGPSSSISKYTRPITGWGCTMTLAGRLVGKVKCEAGIISILSPIPGRGLEAETGSKGRPQAVYNAHRIAQANISGVDVDARLRTRGSAPSATSRNRSAECLARISEILYRLGVCVNTLSTGELKRGSRRVFAGPSARLDPWTVRLPRGGVEIGSTISRFCGKVAAGHNTNNTKG